MQSAGIRCLHIDLGDDSIPPPRAVLAFLDAVTAADGAVAVHCTEGLGRTGTLAAAHLMAAHGFSAREAIGWLRVVRPGSVIGAQQHFLCRLGDALQLSSCGAASLRDAVLSLEPAVEDSTWAARYCDHASQRRCTSAPLVRICRRSRIRPQSEV